MFVFQAAQPALLHIVPSSLGLLTLVGLKRGELSEMWDGSLSVEEQRHDV